MKLANKHLESLKELIILQDKLGRFFQNDKDSSPSIPGGWAPAADLYEISDKIVLLLELPGVEENDVKIDLWENYITVHGERRFKGREENYLCVERSYGSFQRTFRLPAMVEEDKVKAEFKYGVLKISMMKREEPDQDVVRVEIR
jgi:HSP20 family protein